MDLNLVKLSRLFRVILFLSHVSEIITMSGQTSYNKVLKLRILLYRLLAFISKHRGSLDVCWVLLSATSRVGFNWPWILVGIRLTGGPTGSTSSSVSKSVELVEEESLEKLESNWVLVWV